MEILVEILLLILGFVMLIVGANYFVDGTSGIAEKFGIPQLVIGLTIVALGTSAPEAAVSITAALGGTADITIGNVVGSNILNICVILGITAVIIPVAIQKSTLKYEMPFMIAVSAVMLLFGITGNEINLIEGVILWVLLIAYIIYLVKMSKNSNNEEQEPEETEKKKKSVFALIIFALLGLFLIIKGSDFTVDSATQIAKEFGMTEKFIGLTVVALGTSLPELVTSVTAALKGKADIAIGNIVGSNILNVLFVVGTTAIITPVVFASNFLVDSICMIAVSILLLICVAKSLKLKRPAGVILLISYAAYFVYLLVVNNII